MKRSAYIILTSVMLAALLLSGSMLESEAAAGPETYFPSAETEAETPASGTEAPEDTGAAAESSGDTGDAETEPPATDEPTADPEAEAENTGPALRFSDVAEDHWAYTAITDMTGRKMFFGITEPEDGFGVFAPDDPMTRAQFIAVLARYLYPDELGTAEDLIAWYRSSCAALVKHGLVDQSALTLPAATMEQGISRAEMAMLMVQAARAQGERVRSTITGRLIADYSTIDSTYLDFVKIAYSEGLLTGYADGSFGPRQVLTRAEAAMVIYRLIDKDSRVPAGPDLKLENFIFLGDSMIANPHYVASIFTSRGHQVLAGGGATIPQFFGLTTGYVTVGASNMGAMTGTLSGRSFNGIVILLGANDIAFMSADQAMDNYCRLLDELNARYTVPIFALAVYPVNSTYGWTYGSSFGDSGDTRNARSNELNRLLEEYCGETDGLYYIDATDAFTDDYGYLIHDGGDGLHISSAYYDLFYDEIEGALRGTGMFMQ